MEQKMGRCFIDEFLDVDASMEPAIKSYRYQRSLPCYGRGQRLCDLQVPEIPTAFLPLEKKNNSRQSAETRPRPGRGRGKGRRSIVKDENESQDHSKSFGGLPEYANSLTDTSSVSSGASNSKDSEHSKGTGKYSQQVSDCYESHQTQNYELPKHHTSTYSTPSKPMALDSSSGQRKFVDGSSSSPLSHSGTVPVSPPLKDLDGWRVHPPCVCQLEGIPLNLDLKSVTELLSSYGSIVDWEERKIDGCMSLRIKFSSAKICDSVEANMDKSDFSGTGSVVRCKHLQS